MELVGIEPTNLLLARQALSQLSYSPKKVRVVKVVRMGVSCLQKDNPCTSYHPHF